MGWARAARALVPRLTAPATPLARLSSHELTAPDVAADLRRAHIALIGAWFEARSGHHDDSGSRPSGRTGEHVTRGRQRPNRPRADDALSRQLLLRGCGVVRLTAETDVRCRALPVVS